VIEEEVTRKQYDRYDYLLWMILVFIIIGIFNVLLPELCIWSKTCWSG